MGESELDSGVIDIHLSKAYHSKAMEMLQSCKQHDLERGRVYQVPHPQMAKTWIMVTRQRAIKMGYIKE